MQHCTACGAADGRSIEIDPDAHEWGEWRITKNPTALREGEKQRVCTFDSSHVEKASVDKLQASGSLLAQMTSKGKKKMRISWTKVENVDGYDVFFARCNHKKKETECALIQTVEGNNTFSFVKPGLKKRTAYKAYVRAYVMDNGAKVYVQTSPVVHAYASGGDKKYTNPKSVKVKTAAVSLRQGESLRISGKVKKLRKTKKLISRYHAPKLRYLSSDPGVATVDAAGNVTANGKGNCTIFVYAVNGVMKNVAVNVN